MKRRYIAGVVVLLLACMGMAGQAGHGARSAPAEHSAPPPGDSLYLPDGLEATLWAETPHIYNPTNIDVDAEGRVWVIEAVDYRTFNNAPERRRSHPQGERVVILDDTDGDGRADTSKTFVQDDDLVAPLGLAVVGNKVYVSASPTLFVYTDTDGDDKADTRETFLTGFGGLDHDHGLHAITSGPGGRFYFNAGNAGPHIVTDQAGWTLRAGSIYSGGTPYMEGNQPGLTSDDGKVWTGGLNLRINPDGTGLDVVAHNFRNSYELAVDSYGNVWNNDNDDDGNASTRVLYAMPASNTGFFSQDGARTWQADQRPDQETFTAHWHQEDPGVIPAGDQTGPGAPTGIVRYEGSQLGEAHRGMLLSADAGRNVIYGYHPEPKGAGFALESTSFVSSVPDSVVYNRGTYDNWDPESRSYWFRPSDVAVGTDGAIYVADWYDARVGGHQMQDSVGYGRIFRITREGDNPQAPALDLSTTAGQLQALRNPAPNVRVLGFRRLKAQGSAVLDEVKALLDADNPFHRARAVWLLAHLGPEGMQEADRIFRSSPDPALRGAAFRALKQVDDSSAMMPRVRRAVRDASPAVRRAAAIYLRDVPLAESREAMVELARRYDGEDRWYLEAFGLAAEGEEAATYELLQQELAVAAAPSAWSDPWSDLVWRLHPIDAIDALQRRASAPSVAWEEQKEAMVALGFINDRAAVAAMEALAQSDQPKVAERAAWWLDYRRTNAWYDLKDWAAEEQTPEERKAIQAMQAQLQTVQAADRPLAERRQAMGTLAKDAHGSRMLMSAAIEGTLPDPIRSAVQDSIFDSPVRTVRVLARHYFEDADGGDGYSAQRIAQLEADRQNGQMVFYAQCAVCHKAGPTGGDVGPELTGIESMFDAQSLADAIIRPDAGIAHGYSPWQVRTTDGAVRYGLLLAENENTIVLKDANGQRHIIGRDRIASQTQLEGVSLMPGPDELQLSPQDVADVVTFLRTLDEE